MMTYRAKYDRAYIDGIQPVPGVLTPEEERGEGLFRGNLVTLCAQCHTQEIQTNILPDNTGLDAVFTDPGGGRGVFRAASLRNIAVTAPYMHDGRFATLREVIDHYDHGVQASAELSELLRDPFSGQVKRLDLSEADKQALEAFLQTLTDNEFLSDPKFANPFQ
jgi:cytochrome c peroxidase